MVSTRLKGKLLLLLFLQGIFILPGFSQASLVNNDPFQRYQLARQWFQEENYALAYPVFRDVLQNWSGEQGINQPLRREEVTFYSIACELMDQNQGAEQNARQFLNGHNSESLKGQLGYYLGMYYFNQQQHASALEAFEKSSETHLNDAQLSAMNFARGYSYFTQRQFTQAKPLLAAVKSDEEAKYYRDANYYYGLILFNDKNYREALRSFEIAKQDPKYQPLIPYYNASINYTLGQKEQAITEAEAAIKTGNQYYSTQLKQLVGHGYFEKGEYAKALPYLEQYVAESEKVKREDLYELGYCYYQANQWNKAIDQFKPLAGGQDTLSQDAMYLLGDAYLKTNQKANARNAFLFCSTNSSNATKKEVSAFQYGKLSYELGYDNDALPVLKEFVYQYPRSQYLQEAKDLLVNVLANTSNYKEALELYESLKGQSELTKRQYARILYNRAQQYIGEQQYQQAEILLDKALAVPYNESVKPLVHFWKGELNYRNGQFEEAAEHFTAFLQQPINQGDVNEDHARYNLAYSLMLNENYSAAEKIFAGLSKKRLASSQLDQDVLVRLADCQYMQKKFGDARPLYTSLIDRKAPTADYATFQTGMIEGAQNRRQAKIDRLRNIETLYPTSMLAPVANMEIASVYMADEQYIEALPYLQKIINGRNTEAMKPAALLKAGIAQNNLDRSHEALQSFTTLLKQYPQSQESEEAIDNVRSIYIEQGRPTEYISFLQSLGRGVDANQADSLTYSAAELALSDGKKDQALIALNNYLTRFPEGRHSAVAHFNSAELYTEKKDFKNAIKHYETVVAKAPNPFAEKSMLSAARINYFEFKDYIRATESYALLKQYATSDENRLEAMRGLVRSQYYSKQYAAAVANAKEIMGLRNAGSDDKIFSGLVLGKNAQESGDCNEALTHYKTVASLSKAEYGAEAKYQMAYCQLELNKLADSEKSAFEVINKWGSYEIWVARSYLLLGDIYFKQKDYFNAKATFKSVAENATFDEIKKEAESKLSQVENAERNDSKMGG